IPFRLRKFFVNCLLQAVARWRIVAFQQERESLTAIALSRFGKACQEIESCFRRGYAAAFGKAAGAIGIIKTEDRGLRPAIRAAVAVGMQSIALDFGRTSVMRFDYERNCAASVRHRSGIKLRDAVNIILRHLAERKDFLLGSAAASGP